MDVTVLMVQWVAKVLVVCMDEEVLQVLKDSKEWLVNLEMVVVTPRVLKEIEVNLVSLEVEVYLVEKVLEDQLVIKEKVEDR